MEGNIVLREIKQNKTPTCKISFKSEGWIKTFSEEQKLRECVASEPSLYEILKEVLERQGK